MQEQEAQPGIFGGILERYADEFWLLFRVIFAILVFLHGIQKAFLLWGFPAGANPGGLGALLGHRRVGGAYISPPNRVRILTRLGAGAICVTMIVAYFGIHARLSPVWPWPHLYPDPGGFAAHGGEVTILWFIVAGIIGVIGGGKYALDRTIFKKEML